MTTEQKQLVNKQLDRLDKFLAENPGASEALYQILSGSVRGPDTGAGKAESTQRLRRLCFPRTCSAGTTGMMNSDGDPTLSAGAGQGQAGSHFYGHASSAIQYLSLIERKAHNAAKAAKPPKGAKAAKGAGG